MPRTEQQLANQLKANKLTIAFAKSMICGLMSHKLSNINGASEILKGSIICYDKSVKSHLLKIKKEILDKYTCESQKVTDELATNLS